MIYLLKRWLNMRACFVFYLCIANLRCKYPAWPAWRSTGMGLCLPCDAVEPSNFGEKVDQIRGMRRRYSFGFWWCFERFSSNSALLTPTALQLSLHFGFVRGRRTSTNFSFLMTISWRSWPTVESRAMDPDRSANSQEQGRMISNLSTTKDEWHTRVHSWDKRWHVFVAYCFKWSNGLRQFSFYRFGSATLILICMFAGGAAALILVSLKCSCQLAYQLVIVQNFQWNLAHKSAVPNAWERTDQVRQWRI